MKKLTIQLSDEVYQRAASFATVTGQPVIDILTDIVNNALLDQPMQDLPVSELSDAQILAQAGLQMDQQAADRQRELLEREADGTLTDAERSELSQLNQLYRALLLKQSQAIREAAARSLQID